MGLFGRRKKTTDPETVELTDYSPDYWFIPEPLQVETRSYTKICLLWKQLIPEFEPPTYNEWAAQVAQGHVLVARISPKEEFDG
jgi:hypothetical protein